MTLNRPIPDQCPTCKATGDFVRIEGPRRMKLPERQVSSLHICRHCTCVLAEDISYED